MEKHELRLRLIGLIESGLYLHCRNYLSANLGTRANPRQAFCVNGLMCEVHRQIHGGEWKYSLIDDVYLYLNNASILPVDVRRFFSSSNTFPMLLDDDGCDANLVALNDRHSE